MQAFEEIKQEMIVFLKREVTQRGFHRVIFGLSGGLDSAVVAFLCQEAFQDSAMAVLMPSSKSLQQNLDDAIWIAQLLKISYKLVPLMDYEMIFESYEGMNSRRYGNLCARARMMILYDLSYRYQALVIGTSNKSERILGYGTIYGDLACAINPIGDLFKTEIFEFAEFLGIPKEIIQKKPSADLYVGQSDEEELGFSYAEIDSFLKQVLQKGLDFDDVSGVFEKMRGEYENTFLKEILDRIHNNRFKQEGSKILELKGNIAFD